MSIVRDADKQIMNRLFQIGCRFGDDVSELAQEIGCSGQRLIAIAKRYDGVRFRCGRMTYLPPSAGSFSKECPGIKNPRSGICSRIPASISVIRRRKATK